MSFFANRINRIGYLLYCSWWDLQSAQYKALRGELNGER